MCIGVKAIPEYPQALLLPPIELLIYINQALFAHWTMSCFVSFVNLLLELRFLIKRMDSCKYLFAHWWLDLEHQLQVILVLHFYHKPFLVQNFPPDMFCIVWTVDILE